MSTNREQRVQRLQQAACDRHARTLARAAAAIEELRKNGDPITFRAVARRGGVSLDFLRHPGNPGPHRGPADRDTCGTGPVDRALGRKALLASSTSMRPSVSGRPPSVPPRSRWSAFPGTHRRCDPV
jgi:hypothetical protein